MKEIILIKFSAKSFCAFFICLLTLNIQLVAADLEGTVFISGKPVEGSTVILYSASTNSPKNLAQGTTDPKGHFRFQDDHIIGDGVFYLVAKGGTSQAAATKAPNNGIVLLTVVDGPFPKVII